MYKLVDFRQAFIKNEVIKNKLNINMKKQLLLSLTILAFTTTKAQTITKDDLKFFIGNEWRMNVDNMGSGSLDLSTGTGKVWDFSSYAGANGKDTIRVTASTVANVKVTSTVLTPTDYRASTSSYSVAALQGITLDNQTTLDLGYPHTYNKTWTGTGSAFFGSYTLALAGSVPASGTIKLPWGTFNCLLVKEVTTGNISSTIYHWETVEHGRVASYNGAKLLVMQSTNFTTSTLKVNATQVFSVFPNPTNSLLNVVSDNGGSVKIFNALGNLVKQFNHVGGQSKVDVSSLSNGMYFVQLTTDKGVQTKSIIVK
jgi:hypothetical protein